MRVWRGIGELLWSFLFARRLEAINVTSKQREEEEGGGFLTVCKLKR